jgi:hypothetical protein
MQDRDKNGTKLPRGTENQQPVTLPDDKDNGSSPTTTERQPDTSRQPDTGRQAPKEEAE